MLVESDYQIWGKKKHKIHTPYNFPQNSKRKPYETAVVWLCLGTSARGLC